MKKRIFFLIKVSFSVIFILFLSSCGSKGFSEEELEAAITSPSPGAVLSGNASITLEFTQEPGKSYIVKFYVGETQKTTIGPFTSPYTYVLDTTTISNANYELKFFVYDSFNKSATKTVNVTISN